MKSSSVCCDVSEPSSATEVPLQRRPRGNRIWLVTPILIRFAEDDRLLICLRRDRVIDWETRARPNSLRDREM